MWQRRWIQAVLAVVCVGCGGSSGSKMSVVPVSGVVTLDDNPLANADVTAIPINNTLGLGGTARCDAQGQFQLIHVRGEKGLPPGEYKATVSLRKRPDGSIPPFNDPTPPIESDAVETLPPIYSDPSVTTLKFNVSTEAQPVEIRLKSSK